MPSYTRALSPPTKPSRTPGRPAAAADAQQAAGPAAPRGVVDRGGDEPVRAGGRPGRALGAPERRVVAHGALGRGARAEPLGELVASRRQRRVVVDPAGER